MAAKKTKLVQKNDNRNAILVCLVTLYAVLQGLVG